jgi:DNA polymerase I-like protein with 3'-5' exonuclease and polymerase domains
MDIFSPYNPVEMRLASEGGKVYTWYTLSGRPTMASKMTSGANYQDQGSGAEIAFRALAALPPGVQDMVVNFVHDEIVLECPDERVEEVTSTLEKTMIEAADSLLMKYGVPTEVESAVGDCWIH